MSYCFLRCVPAKDGRGLEADCPDGVGYLLLADIPGLDWAIFDVEPCEGWSPEHPVSAGLVRLIESGKRYPPALALARNEIKEVFGDQQPDPRQFAQAYARALEFHLSQQHAAPYVVAKALRSDSADLCEGEWYWVLGIEGNPPVASWVSGDFHVYTAAMQDLDLTGQQLKQLGYVG